MTQGHNPQNSTKCNHTEDSSLISSNRDQSKKRNNVDTEVKDETASGAPSRKTLEEKHQRLNDVLENLPVYLILLTPDYHIPFANRFFRERFGESKGKRCFEYLFGRNEPCETCETYTVLKTMKNHRWEWHGPDGRWYDIYDMPFTDTDGSVLIMEVGVDITKRKEAEIEIERYHKFLEGMVKERTAELETKNRQLAQEVTALQQAKEDIRNLALFPHENPFPVLRVSVEGIIMYANQAAEEVLKQWKCNAGECVPPPIQKTLAVVAANGRPQNMEIRCGMRDFSLSLVPIIERGYINLYGHDITENKRTEQALRDNEQRLHHTQELLEAVTLGTKVLIATVDKDFRYTFFNQEHQNELKRLTGKDTKIGMSLMEALADMPEERDKAIDLWGRALKGETIAQTLIFGDPGKYRRWYNTCHTPIRNATGAITGAGEVTSDVTELMQAQEALRESEEKYRMLFHNMAEGFALYELLYDEKGKAVDWRILEINDSYTSHTGFTPDQIVGRQMSELFPESIPEYLPRFAEVVASHTPLEFETNVKITGRYLHVFTFPVKGNLFANIIEDVTERKQAQEALSRSEAHFKLLSETAERLIMWKNVQPVINELCRKTIAHLDCHIFFNYLVDEKSGRLHLNTFAGITDEDAAKIEWIDDCAVHVCGCASPDGDHNFTEKICPISDPRTGLVKSYGIQGNSCHPLMVHGNIIGTLSFGTRTRTSFSQEDLVLMKRVAAQVASAMERAMLIKEIQRSKEELEKRVQERTRDLNKALKRLDLRNKELQDFAFIASHDLREPVRKIQTFGAMIRDRFGKQLPEQAVDYFTRMQNAADRMDKLLESLLGYSRVSTKGNPFVRADLNGLAREAINDLTIIEEKEAKIELGDLPAAEVDPPQFRQLIGNLINNAIKFNLSSAPEVIIRGETDGDLCRIFVEDNGIGFDEQYLDRIFMPLQRLHGRSEYEGSGMGLAICAKVAERHGGNITARSKPGEGSTFIVTLPLRH